MDENTKKEYSIIGTVTIGTDEYRDLIEAVKDAKAEAEKESTARWENYRKYTELEKEVKKLKEKLEKYDSFVKQDSVKDGFAMFLLMSDSDD